MSRVKGSGTSLERRLGKVIEEEGLDCEKNASDLPGKPDFVFRGQKLAVFVDGCFWHGCPEHCRMPKTREEYWSRKICKNIERAENQRRALMELGWTCLRLWEHEVKCDPSHSMERILELLGGSRS